MVLASSTYFLSKMLLRANGRCPFPCREQNGATDMGPELWLQKHVHGSSVERKSKQEGMILTVDCGCDETADAGECSDLKLAVLW